jgi:hypothetical protein
VLKAIGDIGGVQRPAVGLGEHVPASHALDRRMPCSPRLNRLRWVGLGPGTPVISTGTDVGREPTDELTELVGGPAALCSVVIAGSDGLACIECWRPRGRRTGRGWQKMLSQALRLGSASPWAELRARVNPAAPPKSGF